MKVKRLLLQLLVVVTAAGFAASATAAMYKWTDAQGNVQYTETPPPEGNVTEIAPPRPVAAPGVNRPASNESTEKGSDEKSAAGEAPLSPEQQEIYTRNCEAAKANLEMYQTARRVMQPDGELLVMDDEKRQQKLQQTEEQIKRYCK